MADPFYLKQHDVTYCHFSYIHYTFSYSEFLNEHHIAMHSIMAAA